MLKGISPLLSPELLKILAEMGHGDELLLSDAHYPAYSAGVPVLQLPGVNVPQLFDAILDVWQLDKYVENPVFMMAPVPGDKLDDEFVAQINSALQRHWETSPVGQIERFAFYERVKNAHAVVVTGETRVYGNLLIKKGVITA